MANIKSIGGNPIVLGTDGIQDGSITTAKLVDGAVTDSKLAQTGGVLDAVATLNKEVFAERNGSGTVVELKDCVSIVSVDNMEDGLTCLGGKNLLPAAEASTLTVNGVTITSDGNGSYTITRTATATSGSTFLIELPTSFRMPYGTLYYHLGNSVANANLSIGLKDQNNSLIYEAAPNQANRVVSHNETGGRTVRYLQVYCMTSFSGSFTIAPMLLFTQPVSEYVEFGGVSTSTGGLPSVPDGNLSYIWSNAASETPISVTYVTRDDGLANDIEKLQSLGLQKEASGTIARLDHPSYIDGIYESATGDAYTGDVVVVCGENLLPPVSERTVSSYGMTIESDGEGGYTFSGTATGGESIFIPLEEPVTFPDSDEDTIYLHMRNDASNTNVTFTFADESRTPVSVGYAPTGYNRIVDFTSYLKGKTIAYLFIYHNASASFATPMHIRPILTTSSDADGSETFEGVTSRDGGTIPAISFDSVCYMWAKDGTGLTVDYSVGTGYVDARVVELSDCVGHHRVREVETSLENARHIPYSHNAQPLTLLHISDLHADTAAMGRIMDDASAYGGMVDGAICTGDIVANTAGQISSWWNPSIMTCIGNHDTASYSSGTGYDWTALSMADRDAYYIAPFESNWGITHTAGTSYYYKDYTDSNVRLIVMDSMLYMSDSYASQASTQTAWLSNLLSGAITAGLHVLIAIHSPHNGAEPVPCSFTRIGAGTVGLDTSCNTPQTVIDAVATAIGNGLDFIGYIVGHTHQDGVWDAEGDGTQMMYCITCAAVSYAPQWKNSDQQRSTTMDAYNLVTIDTNNKLVKIVRGGGADVDDKMRPRRMLCISYDTGTIVGQEL